MVEKTDWDSELKTKEKWVWERESVWMCVCVCVRVCMRVCACERERNDAVNESVRARFNFTNILQPAFRLEDPKSAKKDSQVKPLLSLSGSKWVKAARKDVDEIDPDSPVTDHILKVDLEWRLKSILAFSIIDCRTYRMEPQVMKSYLHENGLQSWIC